MTVSLRELQAQFQNYILRNDQAIFSVISNESANSVERAEVYSIGYVLRLIEIVGAEFVNTKKLIGEEVFEKLARKYVQTYPSDNFSVGDYSRHFSQFLKNENVNSEWIEYVNFEMALSRALDTADAPQIGMDALGEVAGESWPYIQFAIHPSVSFHQFTSNAPRIIHAVMMEEETIPKLEWNDSPKSWMVWRWQLCSYFESASQEQVWMLDAIREGKTFAEVCEGLCQWLPEEEVAMYAAGSLRSWIEKGIFSAFNIK